MSPTWTHTRVTVAATADIAAGLLADADATDAPRTHVAALRLLVDHDVWLHRADVRARLEPTRFGVAVGSWRSLAKIAAHFPCTASEAAVMRVAVSLCVPDRPVNLAQVLPVLDPAAAVLVEAAIHHVLRRDETR